MGRSCGNCCDPITPECPNCKVCRGYSYTLCFDGHNAFTGIGCSRRGDQDPVLKILNENQINFGSHPAAVHVISEAGGAESYQDIAGCPWWGSLNHDYWWLSNYGASINGPFLSHGPQDYLLRRVLAPSSGRIQRSATTTKLNFASTTGQGHLLKFTNVHGDYIDWEYAIISEGWDYSVGPFDVRLQAGVQPVLDNVVGYPPEHMTGIYDPWDGYGDNISVQLVLEDHQEDADCIGDRLDSHKRSTHRNCTHYRDMLCYRPPPGGHSRIGLNYVTNSQFSPDLATSDPTDIYSLYFYHLFVGAMVLPNADYVGSPRQIPIRTINLYGHANDMRFGGLFTHYFGGTGGGEYGYYTGGVNNGLFPIADHLQSSADNNLFGSRALNVRGCDDGSTGEIRLYTDGIKAKSNLPCPDYNYGSIDWANASHEQVLAWRRKRARWQLKESGTCWYDWDDFRGLDGKYFWLLDENHDEYHVWFRWYQNNTQDPLPSGSHGGYEVVLYPDAWTFRQHEPEEDLTYYEGEDLPTTVDWSSTAWDVGLPPTPWDSHVTRPPRPRPMPADVYWYWWNLPRPYYYQIYSHGAYGWTHWWRSTEGAYLQGTSFNNADEMYSYPYYWQSEFNWDLVMPIWSLTACIKHFLHDKIDPKDRKWTIDLDGRKLNQRNRIPTGKDRPNYVSGQRYQNEHTDYYTRSLYSFLDISTVKTSAGEGLMCYMSDGNAGIAFENNRDNDFYIGGGNCCGGYPQWGTNARLFVTIPCCFSDVRGTWHNEQREHKWSISGVGPPTHSIMYDWGGYFENIDSNIPRPQCGPNDPPCLCHNASIRGRLGDGTTPDGVGKYVYTGSHGQVYYDLYEYRTDRFNCYKCNEFTLEKSTGSNQCDRSHNITVPNKLHICPEESCKDNVIVIVITDADQVYGSNHNDLSQKIWEFDATLFDMLTFDVKVGVIQPRPHANYETLGVQHQSGTSFEKTMINSGSNIWPNRLYYKFVDHCNELNFCAKPGDLGTDYPKQHSWEPGCLRVTWDDINDTIMALANGRAPDRVHFLIDESVWNNVHLDTPEFIPSGPPILTDSTGNKYSNENNIDNRAGVSQEDAGQHHVHNLNYSKRKCVASNISNELPCEEYDTCYEDIKPSNVGWDTTIWAGLESMRKSQKFAFPNSYGKSCNEGFQVTSSQLACGRWLDQLRSEIRHLDKVDWLDPEMPLGYTNDKRYGTSPSDPHARARFGFSFDDLKEYGMFMDCGRVSGWMYNDWLPHQWGLPEWQGMYRGEARHDDQHVIKEHLANRHACRNQDWTPRNVSESIECYSRFDPWPGYQTTLPNKTARVKNLLKSASLVQYWSVNWNLNGTRDCPCPTDVGGGSRAYVWDAPDERERPLESMKYYGLLYGGYAGWDFSLSATKIRVFALDSLAESPAPENGCNSYTGGGMGVGWKFAMGVTSHVGPVPLAHFPIGHGVNFDCTWPRTEGDGSGEKRFYNEPSIVNETPPFVALMSHEYQYGYPVSGLDFSGGREHVLVTSISGPSIVSNNDAWEWGLWHQRGRDGASDPVFEAGDLGIQVWELEIQRNIYNQNLGQQGTITNIGKAALFACPPVIANQARDDSDTGLFEPGRFFSFDSFDYYGRRYCDMQTTLVEHNARYANYHFWKYLWSLGGHRPLTRDDESGVSRGLTERRQEELCSRCPCPDAEDKRWQVTVQSPVGAQCTWGSGNWPLDGTYILDYMNQQNYWYGDGDYSYDQYYWHLNGISDVLGHYASPDGRGSGYWNYPFLQAYGGGSFGWTPIVNYIPGIDDEDRTKVPIWYPHCGNNCVEGVNVAGVGCRWALQGTGTWFDRVEFSMHNGGGPGYWNMHPDWNLPYYTYYANQYWVGVLTFFNGKHEEIISYAFVEPKSIDIEFTGGQHLVSGQTASGQSFNTLVPGKGVIYRGCNIGTIQSKFRKFGTDGYKGIAGSDASCEPTCTRALTPSDAGTINRKDKGLLPEADPFNPNWKTPGDPANGHPYPFTYLLENCGMWDWMPETIEMTLL